MNRASERRDGPEHETGPPVYVPLINGTWVEVRAGYAAWLTLRDLAALDKRLLAAAAALARGVAPPEAVLEKLRALWIVRPDDTLSPATAAVLLAGYQADGGGGMVNPFDLDATADRRTLNEVRARFARNAARLLADDEPPPGAS